MSYPGTYLYAISRSGSVPADLTGVAGSPVRTIAHAGLVAFVSTVPLEEFGEEALRRNLEDLGWLEATARAHHHVVEAVAAAATTAPVRLVTIYRGDEQVRDLLQEHVEEFNTALSMTAGRKEWGVKVYLSPNAEDAGTPGTAGSGRAVSGAAYLRRRQRSLHARHDARRRAASYAHDIDAALTAVCVASRRYPAQDPQLSGRGEWMVLNGAYLVDDERGREFTAAIDALRGSDVDIQVTGPWAPYSFAVLEPAAAQPGEPE